MSKPKWHKGPPPSIGWWPASVQHDRKVLRWWNGEYWSIAAYPKYTAQAAANMAKHRFYESDKEPIKWTERWWT
jgi:hypothetical protein